MKASIHDPEQSSARDVICTRQVRVVIDWMRFLIAAIALAAAVRLVDVTAPLAIIAALFVVYAGAALFVHLGVRRGNSHLLLTWLDAGWVLLLFAFSGDRTDFLPYLFVPLVFAGVSITLHETVKLAIFAALCTLTIFTIRTHETGSLPPILVPFSLLAAGPLTAMLTRRGTAPSRALASATALVNNFEPNRGVESLAVQLLERACAELASDVALMAVMTDDGASRLFLGEQGNVPNELPPEAATIGASLFSVKATLRVAPAPGWLRRSSRWVLGAFGFGDGAVTAATASVGTDLAELVERPFLMIAAAGDGEEGAIRLLLGRSRRAFDEQELELAQHVARFAFPVFRNACLIERLTGKVAQMERLRIGRDMHDSAIQPYIGLKFAIEALARKVSAADPLAGDVGRLLEMMQDELGSMRSAIKGLRESEADGKPLAWAIRSQVKRLSELYNLQVELEADESLIVSGTLSRELPHMVSEALSNIRRHTRSRRAHISLTRQGESLVLAVRNDSPDGEQASAAFEPKSLSSRATALGGYTSIHGDAGGTTVTICLPLH